MPSVASAVMPPRHRRVMPNGIVSPLVGRKNPKAGRKKGVPNRTTALLKADILDAAEETGIPKFNPKTKEWMWTGKGGRKGYLKWLAVHEPKAFATLLGRVLPMQITGEGGGPVRIIDETMTPQQAAQLYLQSLRAPLMIDVTPPPAIEDRTAEAA